MVQKNHLILFGLSLVLLLQSFGCSRQYKVNFTLNKGERITYKYTLYGEGDLNLVQQGQSGYGRVIPSKISAEFTVEYVIQDVGKDTFAAKRKYKSLRIINKLGPNIEKMEMSGGKITYYNNKVGNKETLSSTQKKALEDARAFLVEKRFVLPRQSFRILMAPEFQKLTTWLHKLDVNEVISAAMPAVPDEPLRLRTHWNFSRPMNIRTDTEVLKFTTKYWLMDKKGDLLGIDYSGMINAKDIKLPQYFGPDIDLQINEIFEETSGRSWLNYKTGLVEQIKGRMNINSDLTSIYRTKNIKVNEKTKYKITIRVSKI